MYAFRKIESVEIRIVLNEEELKGFENYDPAITEKLEKVVRNITKDWVTIHRREVIFRDEQGAGIVQLTVWKYEKATNKKESREV